MAKRKQNQLGNIFTVMLQVTEAIDQLRTALVFVEKLKKRGKDRIQIKQFIELIDKFYYYHLLGFESAYDNTPENTTFKEFMKMVKNREVLFSEEVWKLCLKK